MRYFSFCWQRCYVYTDHVLGLEKGSKATDKSDTEVLFLSNKWDFYIGTSLHFKLHVITVSSKRHWILKS